MGDSPDDEALARELHRELNVGPRRRQRRQAAPLKRSNISQKRARSAGSSSRESSTNDDSDDFSDRVIPRPAPKPGQRRGSEPKEDGQVESMHKAIGPLQRSQTAPNPSIVDVGIASGASNPPKVAVPSIPLPKPAKQGPASVTPKSHNLGLARKHSAPAVHKQSTPPKSPRHKKPKTSPPAAVKPGKDAQPPRPSSLPGSHRTGPRQHAMASASQKSATDAKVSLGSKPPVNHKAPGHPKHPSRLLQAVTPAAKSACQGSTHLEGHNAMAVQKAKPALAAVTSSRSEKALTATVGGGKNLPAVMLGKGSAVSGAAAAAAHSTTKPVADKAVAEKLKKSAMSRTHSNLNEQKFVSGAKGKTVTQDRNPDWKSHPSPEHRPAAVRPVAEQDTKLTLAETNPAASQKAITSTPDVATVARKVGATAQKVSESVQKSATVVPHVALSTHQPAADPQQAGLSKHVMSTPAPKASVPPPTGTGAVKSEATTSPHVEEQNAQKAPAVPRRAASPVKKTGAFTHVAPITTASWSEERSTAVPARQQESPKAGGTCRGRPDVASAGSTPRGPDPEHGGIPVASEQQELLGARHDDTEAGATGQKNSVDNAIYHKGAAPPQPATIKAEADNVGPGRALGSSMDAKNEAFDLMNLCPAHSEVGSLMCQETGGDYCVWLRADDILSRAQLGTALSTMYPGAVAASMESSKLEITLVNLRCKQYFHFPANAEFALQGNVPWQEAASQATHMLLMV